LNPPATRHLEPHWPQHRYTAEEARKAAAAQKHSSTIDESKVKHLQNAAAAADAGRGGGQGTAAAPDAEPSIWAAAARVVTLPEAKKVERMVLQNVFDEVLLDFKYYENGADQYKVQHLVFSFSSQAMSSPPHHHHHHHHHKHTHTHTQTHTHAHTHAYAHRL
jgi:hypothetical protein